MTTIIAQKVIEFIHNHADQHQNEVVLSFDKSLLSSFSLFLSPISFHLNFEALVPRVAISKKGNGTGNGMGSGNGKVIQYIE